MQKSYRNLADYLASTGTTQKAFGHRVGVRQSMVSQILAGTRVPSFRLALRIAREARIPVESLVVDRAA